MPDAPDALAGSMQQTCRGLAIAYRDHDPQANDTSLSHAEAAHQCKAVVVLAIAHSRQVKSCGWICGVPMPPQTGQDRLGSRPLGPMQICCTHHAVTASLLNAGAGDNRLSRGICLLMHRACIQ